MPRSSQRPLTLHVSALSNAEYSTYTASLAEAIAPMPDLDWEELSIGVREARGWIKGRYGVEGIVIDQILRYFCPNLDAQDTLSAGQFFAALRLVSHAQNGSEVDEKLVFVQANPERERARSPNKPRPAPAISVPPPPPRPVDSSPEGGVHTVTARDRPTPPVPSPNPFALALPGSQPPPTRPEKDASSDGPTLSNPFRRASNPPPPAPSLSSASSTSSSPTNPRQYASPPLPPRKNATILLPPPRHASLAFRPSPKPSLLPHAPAYAHPFPAPPLKPPKPPQATSPLIKQSLEAAKGAQSKKEELVGLKRERRLEVIKKSGTAGKSGAVVVENESTNGSGDSGEGKMNVILAPMPLQFSIPVRAPSPPQSFYDVAHARIGPSPPSRTSSPVSDADPAPHTVNLDDPQIQHSRIHTDPAPSPAPTFVHTVSPASPISPTNPRRSKSLHHPRTSDGLPPVPPPRRRPESVQVAPQLSYHHRPHTNGSGTSPLSRHLSMTSDTLHRAFEGLRPGAGFESARMKAEGRVWPGGYVKGLSKDGARLVDGGADGFGQDVDDVDTEGGVDLDAMKVPVGVGEGWRTLR